jgi:hypothetical protein
LADRQLSCPNRTRNSAPRPWGRDDSPDGYPPEPLSVGSDFTRSWRRAFASHHLKPHAAGFNNGAADEHGKTRIV